MRRKFQFSISSSVFHFNVRRNTEKQCVNNKKKREKKKIRDESLHYKMRRAGMVISVVVFTYAPLLVSLRATRRCKYVIDD